MIDFVLMQMSNLINFSGPNGPHSCYNVKVIHMTKYSYLLVTLK